MCACVSLLQQLEAVGIRHQNALYIIFTTFTKLDCINSAWRKLSKYASVLLQSLQLHFSLQIIIPLDTETHLLNLKFFCELAQIKSLFWKYIQGKQKLELFCAPSLPTECSLALINSLSTYHLTVYTSGLSHT